MKATDELLKQIKELNIEDFKKQESFDCISIDEYLCSLLTSHNLQPKDIILNLKSGQFHKSRIIGKNAHVNAIYPLTQVDYITFGVGYCLLLDLGQSRASD